MLSKWEKALVAILLIAAPLGVPLLVGYAIRYSSEAEVALHMTWKLDSCRVWPEHAMLIVDWASNPEDPDRKGYRGFQLAPDGAAFRVAPIYYARPREDIVALDFRPYPAKPNWSTLVVRYRTSSGGVDEEVMGDVSPECVKVIRSYLVDYPIR